MKIFYRVLFLVMGGIIFATSNLVAQLAISQNLPVIGLSVGLPSNNNIDKFIAYIEKDLVEAKVNTLLLRIDYNYAYQSHPELRDSNCLSYENLRKIVNVCKKSHIKLVPEINLLGHQSWASVVTNLLRVYPQFDETPLIKLPEKYVWPNADGLYCKSYCPLHPDVHKIVFELIDEILKVCEANDFHAGMDEVFYIGESQCSRCEGLDKAELFANEVNLIRNYLASKNAKLWIWGDRLIDGKTTGMGMWEASYNSTHKAIDLIYKDVIICDWHYDRPEPSALYFAMKGFDVITCSWNKAEVGLAQVKNTYQWRKEINPKLGKHLLGIMETIWSDTDSFIKDVQDNKKDKKGQVECFNSIIKEIGKMEK